MFATTPSLFRLGLYAFCQLPLNQTRSDDRTVFSANTHLLTQPSADLIGQSLEQRLPSRRLLFNSSLTTPLLPFSPLPSPSLSPCPSLHPPSLHSPPVSGQWKLGSSPLAHSLATLSAFPCSTCSTIRRRLVRLWAARSWRSSILSILYTRRLYLSCEQRTEDVRRVCVSRVRAEDGIAQVT